MILFELFPSRMALFIKHILNNDITKLFIGVEYILFVIIPGLLHVANIFITLRIYYFCRMINIVLTSFYVFGWILTANKKAIHLLLKEFVFFFKVFYLIV